MGLLDISVDSTDLLRWSRYLEELPRRTNAGLARALNTVGDGVLQETVEYIAAQSGIDPNEVRRMIAVRPATPRDLNWVMDASVVAPPSLDWSRPWAQRETAATQVFDQDQLVKIITMEDELVCEKCQEAAEASPYQLSEAQALLPIHPNAVLAGTSFAGYGIVTEMVAAKFVADAVYVRTFAKLTPIGPHHPVLTRRGFIAARSLTEGDELLYDLRVNDRLTPPGRKSDHEQMPVVEDVFAALRAAAPATRITAASRDLHGDAICCEREVDVVKAAGGLLPVLDPGGIEQFSELDFMVADVPPVFGTGLGARYLDRAAVFLTAALRLRGGDLMAALAGGHGRPFDPLLFRSSAHDHTGLLENTVDDRTAGRKSVCQGKNALASFVAANDRLFRWDRVLDVHRGPFRGPAFDATTETGLYNSNGYVVHNCRCLLQPFDSNRRLPVEFGRPGLPPQLVTLRQLGRAVQQELQNAIRISAVTED